MYSRQHNVNKKTFPALSFFLWLCACLFGATAQAEVYWVEDIQLEDLGKGFNPYSHALLDSCVQGTSINRGTVASDVRFLGSGSFSRRTNQMYGKLSGEVDFFLFGGGASVEMTSRLSNTDRSFSSVLELAVDGGGVSLEGRDEVDVSDKHCGDEFIYHIKLGHKLYLSTKLYFSSRESYEKFVTKIKIKVLFVTKTKTIVDEVREFDEQARYVIELVSPNNLPEPLKDIMTNNRTNCKIDNLDDCVATTEKLFIYLFSPTGYGRDIQPEDFLPVSVETRSYQESGHLNVQEVSLPADPRLQTWYQQIKDILVSRTQERDYLLATCEGNTDCTDQAVDINRIILLGNVTLDVCRTSDVPACESQYNDFISENDKL
ncbi:hypothetical protein SG34_009015 [Thalassomonas viridans]|uniref:Internalin n=1 Tax=Thalassomonas viridans TaxID=137584 RepID=A0AAE9Z8G6_9GAMM|nr:hypothetical protein [Thalassomonas viridans]WDE07007.1 hypothetical protein SG34_009015 [Thalassomonas viridans]